MRSARSAAKPYRRFRPEFDHLEPLLLLTTFTPFYELSPHIGPLGGSGPAGGYTPAQVKHAYGFDQLNFNGTSADSSGETIAIVDAFNDPNITSDLDVFDSEFGLPDRTQFSFRVVNQTGGATLPHNNGSWSQEISLDVEWAHAIAPKANIVLVEATDDTDSNLLPAIAYASTVANVVSLSWGGAESPDEASLDQYLSHAGVTYVAASGDNGTPVTWPAISSHVLSVGGTTLTLDSNNNWAAEDGWDGSGGGVSYYLPQPSYQKGVVTQSTTMRTNPDVAYNADPNTGVSVYDSYRAPGWLSFGGTSTGAPQWAGLIALADQGLALQGKGPLGYNQALPAIYQLPANDFHDIVDGNNGFPGGSGYDLVTGRGTPIANLLVPDLIGKAPTVSVPIPTGSNTGTAPAAGAGFDELGAYRPSNGTWSLDSNGQFGFQTGGPAGQTPLSDRVLTGFSPAGSNVIPVSADWANLGTTEIGDFEAGTWHVDLNNNGTLDSGEAFVFGVAGDTPVPGHYLPGGGLELAVFRGLANGDGEFIISDSNWLQEGQTGQPIGVSETFIFGAAGDHVVVGDWDGLGLTEVGVFRSARAFGAPNAAVFTLDVANHHAFDSSNQVFVFGTVTDGVVIGDWDGSGTDKVGVYRPATAFGAPNTAVFTLDETGDFQFDANSKVFQFGAATDKYVTGRWAYSTAQAQAAVSVGTTLSLDNPTKQESL